MSKGEFLGSGGPGAFAKAWREWPITAQPMFIIEEETDMTIGQRVLIWVDVVSRVVTIAAGATIIGVAVWWVF